MNSFGLKEYIDFPIHTKGHILDLLCCSGVNSSLKLSKTKQPRLISFRNIKNIDLAALSSGIDSLPSFSYSFLPPLLINCSHYNDHLHTLLDSLAPLKTRTVSFTYSAPWFSPLLRQLKAKGC